MGASTWTVTSGGPAMVEGCGPMARCQSRGLMSRRSRELLSHPWMMIVVFRAWMPPVGEEPVWRGNWVRR